MKSRNKVYQIYSGQIKRCNDTGRKDYKFYGLRGIKVYYTWHEFLAWWRENEDGFINPSCGRIDHTKGYSLDNIRMEEYADNVQEAQTRKRKNVVVTFESISAASISLGIDKRWLSNICRGKACQRKDFTIRFKKSQNI